MEEIFRQEVYRFLADQAEIRLIERGVSMEQVIQVVNAKEMPYWIPHAIRVLSANNPHFDIDLENQAELIPLANIIAHIMIKTGEVQQSESAKIRENIRNRLSALSQN